MEKEIIFSGHTASPSDYDCADGTLALCVNLWKENGTLKPVLQPKTVLSTGSTDSTIVCIHETSAFKHYIALTYRHDQGEDPCYVLSYYDSKDVNTQVSVWNDIIDAKVYQVSAIGNTLVLLTSDGMDYFLWTDNAYKRLGMHLPELELSFGLQGHVVRSDEFGIKDMSFSDFDNGIFSDDTKSKVTSATLAKVNKLIADEATNAGRFMMPFFVRYAYRLYNDDLTMQSAPILMYASTDVMPQVIGKFVGGVMAARVAGIAHDLDYAVVKALQLSRLKDWKDIIKSVDIFISAPLYKYNQGGQCEKFSKRSLSGDIFCKNMDGTGELRYTNTTFSLMYYGKYPNDFSPLNDTSFRSIELPQKSLAEFNKAVSDNASFYLLKSIDIDSLSSERTVIDVPKDYLPSLVTRETLTDDYDSHDSIIPKYAFNYNSRLNITNITKSLFEGWSPVAFWNFCNDSLVTMEFYVFIKVNGKEVVVYQRSASNITPYLPAIWFYYPNTNAYKLVIKTRQLSGTSDVKYYEFKLKKHDFLNGAYVFTGFPDTSNNNYQYWHTKSQSQPSGALTESDMYERQIEIFNKIYTSEINNPFLFPVTLINTVGTGKIIGISTAAKALSQGQFGQFPLYAFSSDGIWALEVSATTGGYSAKQPISRDVCTSADSITQIDTAVLYVTERGLMLIQGSETICLSDIIDNKNDEPFNLANYKGADRFGSVFFTDYMGLRSFKDFLPGMKIIYDDTSRRLICVNPSYKYAYIYSLNEKAWATIPSKATKPVNSYPEALSMDSEGNLLDYSKRIPNSTLNGGQSSGRSQLIVTRPLKLDMPDIYKTINTIILRGNFRKDNVKQILYGSRDLINWFPVYSSRDCYMRGFRGTPFKYYRLVIECLLLDSESISGMTVSHEPRVVNQLR